MFREEKFSEKFRLGLFRDSHRGMFRHRTFFFSEHSVRTFRESSQLKSSEKKVRKFCHSFRTSIGLYVLHNVVWLRGGTESSASNFSISCSAADFFLVDLKVKGCAAEFDGPPRTFSRNSSASYNAHVYIRNYPANFVMFPNVLVLCDVIIVYLGILTEKECTIFTQSCYCN